MLLRPPVRPRRQRDPRGPVRVVAVLAAAACALTGPASAATGPASAAHPRSAADRTALYLVTLRGPGSATVEGALPRFVADAREVARQDHVLHAVGAPRPVYRWTTALDGFAVRLTPDQADAVAALPPVAMVEHNSVRPLAEATRRPLRGHGRHHRRRHHDDPTAAGRVVTPGPRHGGHGIVIGMIDSGIAPDSPLFAAPANGQTPAFRGSCAAADDWPATDCNGKVLAASSYVAGFGAARTGSTTSLSPLDTDGHGTAMATLAAGNAGVPVVVGGHRLGRTGGQAPQAALAIYKACWDAPEPSGDGCATADLVTAIDRATRDGVDVLNLSVGGPDRIDTVDVALLGATEAGIVVVAAAGNGGPSRAVAHPSPWVTTVGAVTAPQPRGRVVVSGPRGRRTSYAGAMLAVAGTAARRVVLGADIPSAGARRSAAALCAPGSLDAGRAHGAIVVCRRGGVVPGEKAQAVALADGVGMVLLDDRPGRAVAAVQPVPTVEVPRRTARDLLQALGRAGHRARARLVPAGLTHSRPRLAPFTPSGDPAAGVVKPDLVAAGAGVLGAVPGPDGDRWDVVSGTSAATAAVSGLAADLLARPGWTPAEVRSALATTASPVAGAPLLRSGAGRVRPDRATRPGLAVLTPVPSYRAWFEGRRADLDIPSIVLGGDREVAHRTVTNLGHRHLYFSSTAVGFGSDVLVTPAALRLAPGQTARFTVRVLQRRGRLADDGYVVWRGATGTVTRIPVVVSRR